MISISFDTSTISPNPLNDDEREKAFSLAIKYNEPRVISLLLTEEEEEEEEEEERSLGAEETCDGYSGMVYVARSGIDTMPSYNTGLLGNYGGRSSHFGYSSTYDGTVSYGRSSSVWGGPHDGRLNRCEYRWGNQFGRGCTINGRATAQSERERYNRRFFSD